MEKLLAMMLVMSLMTVSCGKSGGGSSQESTASATTTTTGTASTPADPLPPVTAPEAISSLPAGALSFKTNVQYLSGFDTTAINKYNRAVAIVKKVVATEAFRSRVLNYTYGGAKQFVQNNGLTNEQIYQKILEAAETLTPAKNNTLDVGVKLYYQASTVIGFTSGSITYINVNTKFFNTFAPNEVAGNLFHEWLHKLGYSHDSAATARRPYSVPYAIGYMIRDLGRSFI